MMTSKRIEPMSAPPPSSSDGPRLSERDDHTGNARVLPRSRANTETHVMIKGRRWRRSDPALAEPLRQCLVDELMNARRSVKCAKASGESTDLAAARARVHDAKVALGERGPSWWTVQTSNDVDVRTAAGVRALSHGSGAATRLDAHQVQRLLQLGHEERDDHE